MWTALFSSIFYIWRLMRSWQDVDFVSPFLGLFAYLLKSSTYNQVEANGFYHKISMVLTLAKCLVSWSPGPTTKTSWSTNTLLQWVHQVLFIVLLVFMPNFDFGLVWPRYMILVTCFPVASFQWRLVKDLFMQLFQQLIVNFETWQIKLRIFESVTFLLLYSIWHSGAGYILYIQYMT